MTFNAGSGGAWGRRGAAIDSSGTAWFTTGDGIYDVTSDPPRYGNSVVGVHMVGDELKLKSYFAPTNWEWLRKRDLDPNNTPTDLHLQGPRADRRVGQGVPDVPARSAVGRRRRQPDAALQDARSSATRRSTFRTPAAGARCRRGRIRSATRWILAPFWGPVHSKFKFEVTHGPVMAGGVGGFKLRERNGKLRSDAGLGVRAT